jgi:hypothetical protein
MTSRPKDWEIYERFIARLIADEAPTDLCVTPNARIKGIISGRARQVDVLIDSRHDTDNSRRIVVDAKRRTRKIDVVQVEAFESCMKDVGANHGYLVCPVGHTKAAEKRAQKAISISLVPLDRLENFDPTLWPRCLSKSCRRGRVFWNGFPQFTLGEEIGVLHFVGKCDQCGRLHLWCHSNEHLFSLGDEDEAKCECILPAFWLTSIECDENRRRSAELHAILHDGTPLTLDRRPM